MKSLKKRFIYFNRLCGSIVSVKTVLRVSIYIIIVLNQFVGIHVYFEVYEER